MNAAAKVLVAEDEGMLRSLIMEVLEDAGMAVLQARDGAEALDVLRGNPDVALLISDVKMPRMGGYELAEAAISLHPTLKIIIMTGYGHEPPVEFLREHAIEVWTKPFDLDVLAEKARKVLQ